MSLISVIMPVYNAEDTIIDSIQSVLDQNVDFELIVINDGSFDNSENKILSISDKRIKYFKQKNSGVSMARNFGLDKIKGEYLCFLDSDDILPENSLHSRLEILKNDSGTYFSDGTCISYSHDLKKITNKWTPTLNGNPLPDLITLSGKSFFGLTWMINTKILGDTRFRPNMTHSEDLLFYIQLAQKGGNYSYTENPVLHYRTGRNSAMSNISGLEDGYRKLVQILKSDSSISSESIRVLEKKVNSILFKSYISEGSISRAIKSYFHK